VFEFVQCFADSEKTNQRKQSSEFSTCFQNSVTLCLSYDKVPETKKLLFLEAFGEAHCFRLFVFSVSKRCKIAKTVNIEMLPNASK
jgi:hypothetical protein